MAENQTLQPESLMNAMESVNDALERAAKYKLQNEVLGSAFMALKENPTLSINDALEVGLQEWDVD